MFVPKILCLFIDTYKQTEFFTLVTTREKGLHARRDWYPCPRARGLFKNCENFSLVNTRVKGLHARRD